MINTVTLLGSSSGRNAGDAALLSGIMDSIDSATGRRLAYEIPTIRPAFVRGNYANAVRPVSMLPWHGSLKMLGIPTWNSLRRADLTLIFDAILFDRALYNPLFNYLSTLYLLLPLMRKKGKLLGCYNVGAGPVNTPRGKKMLREICEMMDFITVRDEDSLKILRNIGVTNDNLLVTADAALNVKSASRSRAQELITQAGLDPQREVLGINISAYLDTWISPEHKPLGREKFLALLAAGINRANAAIGAQLLYVCTQHHDVEVSKDLMQRTQAPKQALISNRTCSHYEIKAVLGALSMLFNMRLHAGILAAAELTPIVALPHQPKVLHFFRTLGLEKHVMDYADISAAAVARYIERGWSERAEMRAVLENRVPVQQAKASAAAQFVAALDRGADVRAEIERFRSQQQ